MLKIKDNANIDNIIRDCGGIIVKDDKYNMDMTINTKTREIKLNCEDNWYSGQVNFRAEILYDLIQAGLVEKVEEER